MSAASGVVVAWASQDVSGLGVHARRYGPDGAPLGGDFLVNTYTTYDQWDPSVGVAADGSFVVVAETGAYRLTRWSVADGSASVFVDNLPGFPYNVSTGSDGLFWVAMGSPRDPALDRLLPMRPAVRKALWAMPDKLLPKPQHTVWVQAYGPSGELVHDLQAPAERFSFVTGVRERGGTVALGSLTGDCLAYFSL